MKITKSKNSKGFLIILVVLLLLIAGYFWWTSQKPISPTSISSTNITQEATETTQSTQQSSPKPQLKDLLTSFPLINQTIDPRWQKISIETTFTFPPGSQGGPNTSHITAKIPSDWQFKTEKADLRPLDYNHNCSTYSITSPDQRTKLNLQIICGGWSVKEKDLPTDAQIVTRSVLRGNDGPHIVSRIRISGARNNFSYFDGSVWIDNDGSIKNQVGDILQVRYPAPNEEKFDHWWQTIQLTLTYNGSENQSTSNLQIADEIAASVFLE